MIRLYRVAEPDPYRDHDAQLEAAFPIAWPDPDGPCTGRNAEAMFTSVGVPYVVDKSRRPAVYRPASLFADRVNRLEKVADVAPPPGGWTKLPTGVGRSTDGDRIALATAAHEMLVYEVSDPALWGRASVVDAFSRPPRWRQAYRADGGNRQVEGVAFVPGSHDVVALAEDRVIQYVPAGAYER